MFPATVKTMQDTLNDYQLRQILNSSYKRRKQRFLLVESVLEHLLSDDQSNEATRRQLINDVFDAETVKDLVSALENVPSSTPGFFSSVKSWFKGESGVDTRVKAILKEADNMSDAVFLPRVVALVALEPLLASPVADMNCIAVKYLQDMVQQRMPGLTSRIKTLQSDTLRRAHERDLDQVKNEAVRGAHEVLLASVMDTFVNSTRCVRKCDPGPCESEYSLQ
jgi:hypothetical protein